MSSHPSLPAIKDISEQLMQGQLGFRAAVYAVVRQIPLGRVLGYGHVAAVIGRPRAARQVGQALAALDADGCASDEWPVPWWRVVRTDGSVAMQGDPNRGPRQVALLSGEGIEWTRGRIPMDTFRWPVVIEE